MTEPNLSQSPGSAAKNRLLPFMLLLFVGSGCAALIYEIVWLQLLQLVIGLTSISLGVLLGTYMGGMCLGSLLLPRFVSSSRHPLRVYAMLELGIGIIGIAVLYGLRPLSDLYMVAGGSGFTGILMRGVIAGVCFSGKSLTGSKGGWPPLGEAKVSSTPASLNT